MTDLSLVYFGAGWDMQPLSKQDYRPFKRFIFIDALPNLSHYQPNQAGYAYAKDRQSFVSKITENALQKRFILCKAEGNHLRFQGLSGRYLDYYINTTVQDSLADPALSQIIRDAKWLHVEGFCPLEFGLNTERDMPNLFRNLEILRGRTKRAHNHCRWLWIGESTLCGKESMFEHCKQHRAQLRQGAVEPKPCRKCGIGTQSKVQLCVDCGQRDVTLACITTERRARSQFKRVLKELLTRKN